MGQCQGAPPRAAIVCSFFWPAVAIILFFVPLRRESASLLAAIIPHALRILPPLGPLPPNPQTLDTLPPPKICLLEPVIFASSPPPFRCALRGGGSSSQ